MKPSLFSFNELWISANVFHVGMALFVKTIKQMKLEQKCFLLGLDNGVK